MIDEQLRTALEQIGQGGAAFVGVEAIVLADLDPGQLLAAACQLVAAVGQVLLGLEQVEALGAPLFAGSNPMSRHRFPLLRWRWSRDRGPFASSPRPCCGRAVRRTTQESSPS